MKKIFIELILINKFIKGVKMKNKRGRPKKDRKKLGLSLLKKSNDDLTELSINLDKTKSRVIEECIFIYKKLYKNDNKLLLKISEMNDDEFFKFLESN